MIIFSASLLLLVACALGDTVFTASIEISSNQTFPHVVVVGEVTRLEFDYTVTAANESDSVVRVSLSDTDLLDLVSPARLEVASQSLSGQLVVHLEGRLPGRAELRFHFGPVNSTQQIASETADSAVAVYSLWIERLEGPADIAFTVAVILLVSLTNVGLGCRVDLSVVKARLMKPIAPGIGLFSQFVFMPLTAYAVVKSISLSPGIALGLFALGCSPGGSASNAYSYLLNGDVSLSVTMTLVSTIAALGFLPLWLFTLGAEITNESDIQIPFYLIVSGLVGIVVPIGLGIFIQRRSPLMAKRLTNSIKYLMGIFLVFVFTVGVYINLYVFYLMTFWVLVASALLPWVGFCLGGLVGFVMRQEWSIVKTIAIETGIQNTGIPIVLLRLSLSGPERDTGIVAPVASSILTPLPLVVALLVMYRHVWLECRCFKREDEEKLSDVQTPPKEKSGNLTDMSQDSPHSDDEMMPAVTTKL